MPCPGGMPERHSPDKAYWMWHQIGGPLVYNQTNVPSNPLYINHIKWQNLNIYQLVLQLFFALYWSKVEKDEVVGAAPTGGAPATSEWSTILWPTKVRLILEVGWYLHIERWESEFSCPYRHVTRVFKCFFMNLASLFMFPSLLRSYVTYSFNPWHIEVCNGHRCNKCTSKNISYEEHA